MTYQMTPEQQDIREAILRICAEFDDEFWLKRDREGGFPPLLIDPVDFVALYQAQVRRATAAGTPTQQ